MNREKYILELDGSSSGKALVKIIVASGCSRQSPVTTMLGLFLYGYVCGQTGNREALEMVTTALEEDGKIVLTG